MMNIALWIVQILLALGFLAFGGMKLFAYDKFRAQTEAKGPSGLPRPLVTFIGIAELAGGLGLILPLALGIAPWLTAWAAAGLATIMLLAILFHTGRRDNPAFQAVLFALAAIVAVGRFGHFT